MKYLKEYNEYSSLDMVDMDDEYINKIFDYLKNNRKFDSYSYKGTEELYHKKYIILCKGSPYNFYKNKNHISPDKHSKDSILTIKQLYGKCFEIWIYDGDDDILEQCYDINDLFEYLNNI